jgi:predicted nuclease of predicted toxin-antitoxin system
VAPRLLLDEHLSPNLAHDLTAHSYDVTCVRDRGLLGLKDWELMDWCIREGRAICTKNEHDFEREHQRRIAARQDHFGIVTLGDWSTEQLFMALKMFLERTEDVDLLNQFVTLDKP